MPLLVSLLLLLPLATCCRCDRLAAGLHPHAGAHGWLPLRDPCQPGPE